MSDSDEYDKISDFEGDESVNGSVGNIEAGNLVVTETVNEDGSESNDSYVYYNSEIEISPPPSIESQIHGHSPDQTTNQKMKDLTIDDSTKVVEESAKTETNTPESSKKAVKPISNEYSRLLEEDRKFELDTKLHEHITNLCFEARRVAANEYEKCADSFGAAKSSQFKYKQFPGVQKGWATEDSKKPEPTIEKSKNPTTDQQNPDATNDAYHKMFLDEQKYINLQIQLAETTDPNEKEQIDKQCKEAEMQWLNSKEEYERFCGRNKASEKMDSTSSNETAGKSAANEQHNDVITEKFFDALDKQPHNLTTKSSMSSYTKNSELDQKIQKAKSAMQALAQNYSSLKLQMYQQKDKNKKAKYSKFCSQAEERWKNAKKEYEKLCKKANEIDSIDPTVAEYRHLKHHLHDVKKQIKVTRLNSDPPSKPSSETIQQVTVVKANESDAIMTPSEKVSTATLNTPATTIPNGKPDHEILLHAYNVTQYFKNHIQELCDKEDITENRTIEFQQYFTNLMKNANDEYKKSTQVYQSLLDKHESTVSATQSSDNSKLDVPKTYYCKKCGNYFTKEKHIISTQFSGALGAATLFSAVENVEHGELAQRDMMTGRHFVKDVYCNICRQKLGWFYETAVDEKQKYKEGATVLENSLLQIKPITVAKETTMSEIGGDAVPGSSKSTITVKSEDQQFEKFILFLKAYEAGQKTHTQMTELLKVLCMQNTNIANSNESQAFVHKILNELCQKLNENQVQLSAKYKTAVQETQKLLEDKTKIESGLLRKREAMDTEDNIFHIMKQKRFKDDNEEDDNQQS